MAEYVRYRAPGPSAQPYRLAQPSCNIYVNDSRSPICPDRLPPGLEQKLNSGMILINARERSHLFERSHFTFDGIHMFWYTVVAGAPDHDNQSL